MSVLISSEISRILRCVLTLHSSAAAVAVRFFKSLSQSMCLEIRKFVLHEDRRSVAYPECHVLGLIPFCVQNPLLHIERRVSIWRVLLPGVDSVSGLGRIKTLKELCNGDEYDDEVTADDCREHFDKFCSARFSISCCRWITEALVLAANGMPAESFSLLLNGDDAPDQSSVLFDIVREDAARHVAQAV